MNEGKSFLKSIGVMGPVVSIIVWIINTLVGDEIITSEETQEIVNNVILLFGAVVGIYGRVRATKKLITKQQ